jgi:predicted DNA-binding transcriptional regulator AlpA
MSVTLEPAPPANSRFPSYNAKTHDSVAPDSACLGRRLINTNQCAEKIGASWRHWLRLCDRGLAPWGVKIGALRRWDQAVVDEWIVNGCPPVRTTKGGQR